MPTSNQGSTSPTLPPPLEEELVDLPGFQAPPTRPADPLDPTSTTTTGPGPSLEGDWADELGEPPASPRTRGTGSSTASTERRRTPPAADWRDFREVTATVVGILSMVVRWVRTRRRPLPDGVWIVDEDQAAAIGDPAARILARHSPITGESSSDMVDGLGLVVAAAGYTLGNLELEAQAAQLGWTPPTPDAGDADA